ncbi:unnamed protein product [Rhodiola kirilowii]
MTTLRCILAIATARGWPLFQLDVDNAFLHGVLEEEVYIKLPPGFYDSEKRSVKVFHLHKSIYGLRQASRQWFSRFSDALTSYGFVQSATDPSLFILRKADSFTILLVYVDDVVITGTSSTIITDIKNFIHEKFRIKDLGHLKFFLGLEMVRSDSGLHLNQRKYALDLLRDNNLLDCKLSQTPMEIKHRLELSTAAVLGDPLPYRQNEL